jgi:hypothetical protein
MGTLDSPLAIRRPSTKFLLEMKNPILWIGLMNCNYVLTVISFVLFAVAIIDKNLNLIPKFR